MNPATLGTKVMMVATARPTFVVEEAERRAAAARAALLDLGAEVVGPPGLIMTPEDLTAAAEHLDQPFDVALHVCASFSDAGPAQSLWAGLAEPLVIWSFREPGQIGDRLWLNSLCGANLVGHAVHQLGIEARSLHGDPDEPVVQQHLTDLLRGTLPPTPAPRAVQRERADPAQLTEPLAALRHRTIGLIGEAPPGFTPCEYDPEVLRRTFGLEVAQIAMPQMVERIGAVTPADRDRELTALHADRPSVRVLDDAQVATSATMTTVLRDWRSEAQVDAMAVRCWPEIPTELGACPCGSMSRLADESVPMACERDVYGVVTMLVLAELGAGPTYLVDTVDLLEEDQIVRVWHCGSAATALVADGHRPTQSVHCNRKLAVVGDFPLRTGPVQLIRLTEDTESPSGLRLLIAAGESIPAPNRFQGNSAEIRLDQDAATFVSALIHQGFPHHTVLAWTDVRPQLRALADQLGIRVVEWASTPPGPAPRTATHESP